MNPSERFTIIDGLRNQAQREDRRNLSIAADDWTPDTSAIESNALAQAATDEWYRPMAKTWLRGEPQGKDLHAM